MERFRCPYLNGDVELSDERERHIAERHPELIPKYRDRLAKTLSDPDEVRRSARFGQARLFSRWYEDVRRGKFVIVVVVTDSSARARNWVVTAYIARKLSGGEIEWKRS